MRLNLPKVGSFSSRPKRAVWSVAALLLLLIVGAAIWAKFNNTEKLTPTPTIDINDKKAVSNHLAGSFLNYAEQEVNNKNNDKAVEYFILAANEATKANKYPLARSILEQCVQSIPDSNVPASVYYKLATVAKELRDSGLEKDSLQKALPRSSRANSGIYPGLIESMSKRLEELK